MYSCISSGHNNNAPGCLCENANKDSIGVPGIVIVQYGHSDEDAKYIYTSEVNTLWIIDLFLLVNVRY